MLAPGDILDHRYEILAPLAEGGMGAVYRARRTLLGDEVAIKVVRGGHEDRVAGERFLRESRVAASLRHPSIVSILDFDMPAGGEPYLVMELLSGPSLREEIDRRGRLELADVHRIIPGICAALQLAHSHDVVHRDIKPANIVAHQYHGVPRAYKLVDFGIANLRQTSGETRLTSAHQFVGTVAYASPEQLSGRPVDARSDVYSLAAVVYEMLTGQLPFGSGDLLAMVTAQMSGVVPHVRDVRPDLPEWIEAVLVQGLARDPEARWRSAAEFEAALAQAGLSSSDTTAAATVSPGSGLAATYQVGQKLGPGRLGSEVFAGVHRLLGHPVAIRLLRPGSHPNWEAAKQRFLREARALQVSHESIIQVRDYGEEPGLVYIVTDYIEGPSVRTLLNQVGRVEWPRLRPLLAQLTAAARVLHRRKALLCGLNPDIMRVRAAGGADADGGHDEERLLISTAGIWTAQDLLATLNEKTLRGVSLEDVELRYVAPELLTGGAVDVRSDIFTIGVLAYELATGALPFDGRSMPELLGRMLSGSVEDPLSKAPELPDLAAAAITRALSPAPAGRFGNVREFARALTVTS